MFVDGGDRQDASTSAARLDTAADADAHFNTLISWLGRFVDLAESAVGDPEEQQRDGESPLQLRMGASLL